MCRDRPISPGAFAFGPPRAAERSISESTWCLFLDVDGTLLDIADTPESVKIEPQLLHLLSRLRVVLEDAVALVSGRPITQLDQMFGPHRWTSSGIHGLERRDAHGRWHRQNVVDTESIALARTRLQRLADRLTGTSLEDKGLSVALHYRQASHLERQVRAEARSILRDAGGRLTLIEGRMVVELRPHGASKAEAIREFLKEDPFRGRRPIFIGDDTTDEPALGYVERVGGLSVAVGDRVQGMVRVSGPRDVRVFLEELAGAGTPPL